MNIRYSNYNKSDYEELKDMIYRLYNEDPTGMPITDDKITKTINENTYHPEKIQIIIMRDIETVIGYCITTYLWSNEYGGNILNVDELYIKKEYRNRQMGSNFMKHILNSNKDAVLYTLEVTPSNKEALKFYEKLGFVVSKNVHMMQINKLN